MPGQAISSCCARPARRRWTPRATGHATDREPAGHTRGPRGIGAVVISSGIATQYWNECLAYPPGDTASLWLFVDNAWRHFDTPDRASLDLVQRAFLGSGSQVRVWYAGDVVAGLVVEGS